MTWAAMELAATGSLVRFLLVTLIAVPITYLFSSLVRKPLRL